MKLILETYLQINLQIGLQRDSFYTDLHKKISEKTLDNT